MCRKAASEHRISKIIFTSSIVIYGFAPTFTAEIGELSPKTKIMTKVRSSFALMRLRLPHEETLHRRADYQSDQGARGWR